MLRPFIVQTHCSRPRLRRFIPSGNHERMTAFTRRNILRGALAAAGAAAVVPATAGTATAGTESLAARPSAVALVRNRLTLPSGIATGDVTADSGVLWSR